MKRALGSGTAADGRSTSATTATLLHSMRGPLRSGLRVRIGPVPGGLDPAGATGSHVALVVAEEDSLGHDLVQGMNFTGETLIVQAPE